MIESFASLPPSALGATIFVAALIVFELGFRYGRGRRGAAGSPAAVSAQPFGPVESALFGLVALLLGFSFSLSTARFDARSRSVVTEAGAFATLKRETALLPSAASAVEARGLVRDEVADQLAFYRDEPSARAREVPNEARLWAIATDAAKRDPQPTRSITFANALGAALQAATAGRAFSEDRVPRPVLWLLLAAILVVAAVLGHGFGRSGGRRPLLTVAMLGLFALTVLVVAELDDPNRGVVETQLAPLERVAALANPLRNPANPRMERTPSGSRRACERV
ncbi:MAG: hypothetical protein ACREM2_09665 [Vulcanimicrobiaceae bacterium]